MMLDDIESFAQWLAQECDGAGRISSEWITRVGPWMVERMAQAKVAELVQLMLTELDPVSITLARAEILKRYEQETGDVG